MNEQNRTEVLTRGRSHINRPKDSDFDLPSSRERQRVVIRPLAGARSYRKLQSSQDVGLSLLKLHEWKTEAGHERTGSRFGVRGNFSLSSNGG